jgi:hypothetical protein
MKNKFTAFDSISLSEFTANDSGFLVANANIGRIGIQEYYAYEFGLDSTKTKVLKIYRPPEEVFNPLSMQTFENSPVTNDHPKDGVTPDNWQKLAKGEVTNIKQAGDYLSANIIVKSADAISAINSGKKELSCGYSFMLDLTPGITGDGLEYDGRQLNIVGNHVAIVDKARCGAACRIFDNAPDNPIGGLMADLKKMTVDGIPLEVSDLAAAAIDKLLATIGNKESEIAGLNASVEALATDLQAIKDSYKVELDSLKSQVMTPQARDAMVEEWAKLIGDAKVLKPDVVTSGKNCAEIRKEVLSHVAASDSKASALVKMVVPAIDSATDEDLKKGIQVALASIEVKTADTTVGKMFASGADNQTSTPELSGRDKFLKVSQDAWKGGAV